MKKILITGAGSGLGAALAKCYADEDSYLILVGRSEEKLKSVLNEIREKGALGEVFVCDIKNSKAVEELKERTLEKHNSIDYLINNAGVGYFGPLTSLSANQVDDMIDTNVKGTIFVTLAFLPYVKERVLNIISTAGLKGKVNESVYVASKYGIRGFTESLQKELEGTELKITAVYMGGMNTPFWKESENHIKNKSRFKAAEEVAKEIKDQDDGREEIIIK